MTRPMKGSKTERNLLTAFAGESQARNRYTFFADKAAAEGYQYIAAVFRETADHEKVHGHRLFSFLEGGDVEILASYPAGKIGTTMENLEEGIAGEHYENTVMYPEFAKVAEEEGFTQIAGVLKGIAHAEEYHESRYREFVKRIQDNIIFEKTEQTTWRCLACGYHSISKNAPKVCAACGRPQSFFQEMPII